MSLLMQALKKAEEANKNKPQPAAQATPGTTTTPSTSAFLPEVSEFAAAVPEGATTSPAPSLRSAMPSAGGTEVAAESGRTRSTSNPSTFPTLALADNALAFESETGLAPTDALAIVPDEPQIPEDGGYRPAALDEGRTLTLEPSLHATPGIDAHPAGSVVSPVEKEAKQNHRKTARDTAQPAAASHISGHTSGYTTAPPPATGLENGDRGAREPTAHSASNADATERKRAQTVFSAKQSVRTRNRYLVPSAVAIAGMLAAAGYLYWQMQTTHPPLVMSVEPAPAQPQPETEPTNAEAPSEEGVRLEIVEVPENPGGTPTGTGIAATAKPAGAASVLPDVRVAPAVVPDTPSTRPAQDPVPSQQAPRTHNVEPLAGGDAIRIRRGNAAPNSLHTSLQRAYTAFNDGELARAREEYRGVLRLDPANRDALLGSAMIALREQAPEQAVVLFGRLLELDPSDPDAIAGLAGLQQGDPSRDESRLKQTIAQQPQSAAAWFALGNLYARQARWPDAQQAFFRAFGAAPSSADYAYNLAVSLDHLGQSRLAADYYQRAVTLAREAPAGFDKTHVQERMRALQAAVQ